MFIRLFPSLQTLFVCLKYSIKKTKNKKTQNAFYLRTMLFHDLTNTNPTATSAPPEALVTHRSQALPEPEVLGGEPWDSNTQPHLGTLGNH